MTPWMNEDVAWERLKDMQREMENSRVLAASISERLSDAWRLAVRAWLLAGLAMRRPPRPNLARRHPVLDGDEVAEAASDAA